MPSKTDSTNECPAAKLADEAQRLIGAHRAVDDASAHGKDEDDFGSLMGILTDALDATADHVSWVRALSAKGALYQLCIATEMARELAMDNTAEGGRKERAIYRLLHSVSAYIEETNSEGATVEGSGGGYYTTPAFSELTRITEALSLARKNQAAEAV